MNAEARFKRNCGWLSVLFFALAALVAGIWFLCP